MIIMKKFLIGVAVILLLVVLVIFGGFYATSSPTTNAFLVIEKGVVQVDQGNGFKKVANNVELYEGAKIKTLDGEASVVLKESVVLHLDSNSEIVLEDLSENLKVSQVKGSSWNKFVKSSSVEDLFIQSNDFSVLVKGTQFSVSDDKVMIVEGKVSVKKDSQIVDLSQGSVVVSNGRLIQKELTLEDKQMIISNMKKVLLVLKAVRDREIEKHSSLLSLAEKNYGVTREKIDRVLAMLDNGDVNPEDYKDQIDKYLKVLPVSKKTVDKAFGINKAIRDQVKLIHFLEI